MVKKQYFVKSSFCLLILLLNCERGKSQNNYEPKKSNAIHFEIKADNRMFGDTMILQIYENTLGNGLDEFIPSKDFYAVSAKEDVYKFDISLSGTTGYLCLKNKNLISNSAIDILKFYFFESGDSISIFIKKDSKYLTEINKTYNRWSDLYFESYYLLENYSLYFHGVGSDKYKCRYEADRLSSAIFGNGRVFDNNGNFVNNSFYDLAQKQSLSVLEKYRSKISRFSYGVMLADFISKYYNDWLSNFIYDWKVLKEGSDHALQSKIRMNLISKLDFKMKNELNEVAKSQSAFYALAIFKQYQVLFEVNGDANFLYNKLKSQYKGLLRDKLLTIFILRELNKLPSSEQELVYYDARFTLSSDYCISILQTHFNALGIGKHAYNFALPDMDGNIINLDDFKGKVIIIDFWFTGCSACRDLFSNSISKVEERYQNDSNVVFISISIDRDKVKWINSIKSQKYTSLNSVNLFTSGQGAENEIIKHYKIQAYPTLLLVDQYGKIFNSNSNRLREAEFLTKEIERALTLTINSKMKNYSLKVSDSNF
mgnify:CR=1 FL=1|jgi:Uncharacterized protein SCO1/SenC/PrrC, involved in biogenesis of respiratory and photosynthetic systems